MSPNAQQMAAYKVSWLQKHEFQVFAANIKQAEEQAKARVNNKNGDKLVSVELIETPEIKAR